MAVLCDAISLLIFLNSVLTFYFYPIGLQRNALVRQISRSLIVASVLRYFSCEPNTQWAPDVDFYWFLAGFSYWFLVGRFGTLNRILWSFIGTLWLSGLLSSTSNFNQQLSVSSPFVASALRYLSSQPGAQWVSYFCFLCTSVAASFWSSFWSLLGYLLCVLLAFLVLVFTKAVPWWFQLSKLDSRETNGVFGAKYRPLMFFAETFHSRFTPQLHKFVYPVLYVGFPVHFEGTVGGLFSVRGSENEGMGWFRQFFSIFDVAPRNYVNPNLSFRKKIETIMLGKVSQWSFLSCVS